MVECGRIAPDMAHFYASLLDWDIIEVGEGGWWAIVGSPDRVLKIEFAGSPDFRPPVWPGRRVEEWAFDPDPAPRPSDDQQMMMHLDIEVTDISAGVERVLELGGSEASWQPANRDPNRIRIMLDPAGHPLCLFLQGE